MKQAVIFDLDDTLYRERRFMLSGLAAASHEVERRFGVPSGAAFATLRRACAAGRRPQAFQALCGEFGLPERLVDDLQSVVRTHRPQLRLPRTSLDVLRRLRKTWRVGVLTNGSPSTQANKVAALGLIEEVDAVVYADSTGAPKPDQTPFAVMVDWLGVPPAGTVFVGDDPWCDIFGARRAGMKTIRVRRPRHHDIEESSEADAVVDSLCDVPACALALVHENGGGRRHVV